MKSSGIGGQAVMEGVMMKNKDKYAVAVRKPDKTIEVKVSEYKTLAERYKICGVPIIRGVVAFVESLVVGMKTLTYSASFFEEEEKKNSKKDKESTGKKEEQSDTKEKLTMAATVILSIILAVGIFMVLPYFLSRALSNVIESEAVLTLLEGVIRVLLFLGYVLAISQMKDIKRVFMYHGAEHKSINCIEHGMELTVENVRKHSRLHKRCGTSFLLVVMCVSILLFMFIRTDTAWLRVVLRLVLVPVIAGLSYEFIKLAGRSENPVVTALSKPGLWLQGLTTREPDDDMIECAIKSVEAVFDWKPYVEEVRAELEKLEEARQAALAREAEEKAEIEKAVAERKAEKAEALKTETEKLGDSDEIDFLDVEFKGANKKKKRAKQTTKYLDEISEELETEDELYRSKDDEMSESAVADELEQVISHERTGREIGITPDSEEDDEILQKLDKFFVLKKKGN